MKKFFLIFIFCTSALAADPVLSFGEFKVIFTMVDGVYVNRSCKDKKCEAYQKFKSLYHKPISPDLLNGGKNPSAVRCKEVMQGEVLIGRDRQGHDQSACRFKDGSFLI